MVYQEFTVSFLALCHHSLVDITMNNLRLTLLLFAVITASLCACDSDNQQDVQPQLELKPSAFQERCLMEELLVKRK